MAEVTVILKLDVPEGELPAAIMANIETVMDRCAYGEYRIEFVGVSISGPVGQDLTPINDE